MTVFELLKKDHEKVSGIFEQIEQTTERAVKTREESFAQLKAELDIHAQIEEMILYPALEEFDETRDIALEGVEEHRVVKTLLAELEAMPVDDEQWTAKFTVLKENVEHHVEEEEGEMFKKARQVLSQDQIEEMTARVEAEKKTMKASMRG
jgi:Hemerythrin HHE cation binding domain